MPIRQDTVLTAAGPVNLARCGQGPAVLLLHQTPRSWREYEHVLPLLGQRWDCIAMDTVGYGDTPPFADGQPTVERWATAALALMDTLGISNFVVVGHHTGAVIGMEIAAQAPGRVRALVLSSCPYVDAARRAQHGHHPVVDGVSHRADGGHLLELWRGRQHFYPEGDVDLLERFVADALRAGPRAAQGHLTVNRYHMEERIGRLACPTLLIGATADPHAYPAVPRLAQALPHARRVDIEGGMVPLPDQLPQAFAAAVDGFIAELPR
jgi:pimeloyl-ACP methyl ester carboxylesterase